MAATPYPLDPVKQVRVTEFKREYANYVDSSVVTKERKRLLRNFDYYNGIDFGQWQDKALVAQLQAEGKPVHTFNWIMGLLDTTIGHLMQAPVDTKFVPPGVGSFEQTDVLQSLYEMDVERDDYLEKKWQWRRDALVHTGIIQFTWDKSDDPLGNVGVKVLNPKHVIRDPYWNTSDIRDSRATYVYSWLTADQIKETWGARSPAIEQAIERNKYDTRESNFTAADRSQPYYDQEGSLYKVIEAHWCETRKKLEVIDLETGATIAKFSSEDYAGYSKEVLDATAKLDNPNFAAVTRERKVSRIFTFCPALAVDLILEDGEYPLQLGRQPFIFFSYKEDYEDRQGLVDKLIDPADVFNKRQSMVSHALGGSTGAGVFWAEQSVFNGDQTKIADFQARISQNGQLIEMGDNALSENRIREVNRPQIPMDILKSTEDQRTYMQDLAGITPGMQGYSEKGDESGKLYKSKVRQAMIGLEMFSEMCKAKDKEFARCYMMAAKQIYSGPSRKFLDRSTNSEFWVNRTMLDSQGNIVKMNCVEDMPDYLIAIEERRTGKVAREARRQEITEAMRYVRNPVSVAILETELMRDFDFPEKTMAQFENAANLWIKGQAAQVDAGMAQSEMVVKQAQAAGQPQPQPGVPAPQGA